jgi:hypothetical protein
MTDNGIAYFRRYIVTMRHDKGLVSIETVARNAEVAIDLVCKAEHAPRSAVVSVTERLSERP